MKIKFLLPFLILACGGYLFLTDVSQAAEIQLKSGETFEAKIVERGQDYIKVDFGYGIDITYYEDEIERVDGKPYGKGIAPKPSGPPQSVTPLDQLPRQPQVSPSRPKEDRPASPSPSPTPGSPQTTPTKSQSEPIPSTSTLDKKFDLESLAKDIPMMDEKSKKFVMGTLLSYYGVIFIFFLFIHILLSAPVVILARRTQIPSAWMGWIPIVQFYLFMKIAKQPGWWIILIFIPLVQIVILVIIWAKIAEIAGKPSWWGVLILVPGLNVIIMWYIALTCPKTQEQARPTLF